MNLIYSVVSIKEPTNINNKINDNLYTPSNHKASFVTGSGRKVGRMNMSWEYTLQEVTKRHEP